MKRLEDLRWDNTYARLPPPFYARLAPTPLRRPRLIAQSPEAAALLDLGPAESARPEYVAAFNGDRLLPGMEPLSAIYAGHQFGQFVPQLGDGRAILLGEVTNAAGERWDVQVKGAGPTPFSRMGDGRAVLRSTIREYLCSEAMHGLGIPTTRALSIIGGDDEVYRESVERGALLVRLAPSHVRFGSFELFGSRGQIDEVRRLADYVIERDYPHLTNIEAGSARYVAFFAEVVRRTATLIAKWQSVGFAHGVMNTDNMSIVGVTLDYGPYGFLDEYDPALVCNHSDHSGRYAFHRQPSIGLWNASCLGEALLPLMKLEEAQAALDAYEPAFMAHHLALMQAKIGIDPAPASDEAGASKNPVDPPATSAANDAALISALFKALRAARADYTRFFRALALVTTQGSDAAHSDEPLSATLAGDPAPIHAWLADYRARLQSEPASDAASDDHRRARMNAVNPAYVLRNHLAQAAIERSEAGDHTEIDRLRALLANPYVERPGCEHYAQSPPEGSEGVAVSCSS